MRRIYSFFIAIVKSIWQKKIDNRFYKNKIIRDNNRIVFDENILHLFCVAFNNHKTLDFLLQFTLRNLYPNVKVHIVDNSSNETYSNQIKEIATRFQVNYFKLPDNPYSGVNLVKNKLLKRIFEKYVRRQYVGSCSHGAALNWICYNLVNNYNVKYFGFIDHDLMPIIKNNILPKIQDFPFYGRIQIVNDAKYLWPGYCFFNGSKINPLELNFMPGKGADTGAMNAESVFKNFDWSSFNGATYRKEKILEGDDLQAHYIEYIDGWLHVINASSWKTTNNIEEKDNAIYKILISYLS